MIMRRRKQTAGTLALLAWLAGAGTPQAAGEREWLAICAQCITPTVQSKSGIGTAAASAVAKVTRADAEEWCGSWRPGERGCIAEQLASDEARRTYRASADCTKGRITPIDGETYTLAGVWDASDIGAGRTRWRDASGQIVGRDNASGGLGISQQWEVLCPKGAVAAAQGRPSAAPSSPAPLSSATRSSAPGQAFLVGQSVEALFMGGWVPARITRVYARPGGQTEYDVALANGRRGVVPARMLRPTRR